jgi:hypothetical protein
MNSVSNMSISTSRLPSWVVYWRSSTIGEVGGTATVEPAPLVAWGICADPPQSAAKHIAPTAPAPLAHDEEVVQDERPPHRHGRKAGIELREADDTRLPSDENHRLLARQSHFEKAFGARDVRRRTVELPVRIEQRRHLGDVVQRRLDDAHRRRIGARNVKVIRHAGQCRWGQVRLPAPLLTSSA